MAKGKGNNEERGEPKMSKAANAKEERREALASRKPAAPRRPTRRGR